jgi:hypothetical protein
LILLSFQLLDRGVIRAAFLDRRTYPREESAQAKEQTMKEAIGLEKRAKGEELGYDEGESCPHVHGIPGHEKSVG